eukprot:CAMPEP_0118932980 /NCGR_PEP_ID=MMETSP1169-20130426/10853_1 /TAXON_ID=36882 /ORGANISM="Pyramimonas obovata, Strain CCMP722" /LENGTH=210 /DNA_ID=CAMNT_0006875689 /DNA_START=246 /DNA_END=878 /DNA_ORIENTATION=+
MHYCTRPAEPPRWVEPLLSQKFFNTCTIHASMKKNECNNYCVDCISSGLCQHCLHEHQGHRTLQIRRYVYHDVVRIQDLEQIIVMDGVQSYHINNASVAFLNQRPKLRPMQNPGQTCETCSRGLQDNNRFCSLACKVQSLTKVPGSQFVPQTDDVSCDSGGPQTPDLQSFNNTFKRKLASSSDEEDDEVNNYRRSESRRKKFVPRRSPVC